MSARTFLNLDLPEADYDSEPLEHDLIPMTTLVHTGRELNACDSPDTGSSSRATAASDSPLVSSRHVTTTPPVSRRRAKTQVTMADITDEMLPSYNMTPISPGGQSSGEYMRTQRLMRLKSRDSSVNLTYLTLRKPGSRVFSESYAAEIAGAIERDQVLMDDTPESEALRLETLRVMPETLGLKRNVKERLSRTVSLNSQKSPPGATRRFKYRLSSAIHKMRRGAEETVGGIQLWYNTIKDIEGRFGSGVATYFRFLRSLFLLNLTVLLVSFSFLVTPQLLDRFYIASNLTDNSTHGDWSVEPRPDPYGDNLPFNFGNLFTGEGWFIDTELYYGTYSNSTVQMSRDHAYDIPNAYFFTISVCYIASLIYLSTSMARSYRRNFIEMQGGLQNTYAQKIFCGWDFGIVTGEAAQLRSQSIYNELRELLEEEQHASVREASCQARWALLGTRAGVTALVATLLVGSGVLVWFLLDKQDEIFMQGSSEGKQQAAMMMSLVITFVMLFLPMIFSRLSALEKYENPRNAVFVTLLRTFGLEVAIVGVLLAYWLSSAGVSGVCWETNLGKEVYRLIIVDFFICLIGTSLAEFIRSRLNMTYWKSLGAPEFDIARNTLHLIYNQTLFWVGFYFSPLLAAVIVIKLLITFYLKKLSVMHSCQPSPRSWRAAQTHTVFLALTFLAIIGVLVTMGYVITQVEVSDNCGPFRDVTFTYEKILRSNLKDSSTVWKIVLFFTKPGVVAFIIVALCVSVYYMRAVSRARGTMVELLRNMLALEAEDKLFLQQNIRDASKGQWVHHSPLRTRVDILLNSSPRKSV